jgi:hypothetical protein
MATFERTPKSRANTQGGLRMLTHRSRRVLRLLGQALKQDAAGGPKNAARDHGAPPASNEHLLEAVELAQALHSRFALLEQRFALLSEKVDLLGVRLDEPTRGTENEATLRPPKVPRDLAGTVEATPVANAFTLREPDPAKGGRQQSGFELRASGREEPRTGRSSGAGPLMSGNMTGLSLSSLFSLLEFERSSGSLTVQYHDRRLDLLLRAGRVVRCELDGVRTAATASVREAFAWSSCTFSFRRDPEHDEAEPPQSVNALMLDAMRFHDEQLRTG